MSIVYRVRIIYYIMQYRMHNRNFFLPWLYTISVVGPYELFFYLLFLVTIDVKLYLLLCHTCYIFFNARFMHLIIMLDISPLLHGPGEGLVVDTWTPSFFFFNQFILGAFVYLFCITNISSGQYTFLILMKYNFLYVISMMNS